MTKFQGQSKDLDNDRPFSLLIGKADGRELEQQSPRAASRPQQRHMPQAHLSLDVYCAAGRSATNGAIIRQWYSRVAGIRLAYDSIRPWPRRPSAGQLVRHVIAAAAECSGQRGSCDVPGDDLPPRPVIQLDGGILHRRVGAALREQGLQVVYGPASPRPYR